MDVRIRRWGSVARRLHRRETGNSALQSILIMALGVIFLVIIHKAIGLGAAATLGWLKALFFRGSA